MQALGFNAIRVPFSFQALFKSTPNSFTKSCTPISQADLRANLSPPGVNIDPNLQLPIQVHPLLILIALIIGMKSALGLKITQKHAFNLFCCMRRLIFMAITILF